MDTSLGAQKLVRNHNWYALFAVAGDGQQAELKIMPFLRLGKAGEGGFFPFIRAGEIGPSSQPMRYDWSFPGRSGGNDVLVISETSRPSGRVTAVSSLTPEGVVLNDRGNISEGDFILPAPPDAKFYSYLGSFYFEAGEIRNIFDSGSIVRSRMIALDMKAASTEKQSAPVTIDSAGYISPLATAIYLESHGSLSTSATGPYGEYFSADGVHILDSRLENKCLPGSVPYGFEGIVIPFLYGQTFYYANDGPLAAARIEGRLLVTGWIEP